MSKDLSKGGVEAVLKKDTKSLCGTKHYLNMLVDGGATIIRPYTQEDGYTKEMLDNFAKRGITHQKKGILTAGYTKLRVRFSPYDTVGWDVTEYHQGDSMFHKIRIRLYCDGKLKQQRDMSGPVDGGATQEVFLLTENGKWTVEAEPIAAGECATPDEKSDIAFVNLEPVPQGWEIESGIDEGEEDETKNFTNELKPLATVGLIGLGALVLTRLMKRRRSSKEAEDISTLYTHGKWRRPVRFRNLDDVNKYDGAIELQGYGFCPAKLGENLKIGDVLVWNNGYKSRILDIQPKGKQSLDLTTMTEDTRYKQGQEFERTIRKNRLVGVAQDYHKYNGVMIKDLPPIGGQKQETYNPYEKMLRKRMGLSAEERKKGFIPFEELEVGDVFVFKNNKEDKTWERFVLKSKEVDNIDIDDETGEWVDIYHFVIDPYKPSPVSDINGTARGDTIVFRWTNPYEEMILKRRQGTKKEAETFESEYDEEDMVHCNHCSAIIGNEKEVYGDETVEYEMANGELVCIPCYKEWMEEYERDLDPQYSPFYAENEERLTLKKTGDNVYDLEYKGHKGRLMKIRLQGDKPYYSLSAYIDLTPFQTERIEIGRLMPKVEEGEDGLIKELSWNNSDVYGSRGNPTTLKEGKKRFKGFIDKLEHGEKFMSPKGTWLNKKNISQDDSTKKLMAYDELFVGEQDYGFGDKREMRYSPETLENNIGRMISREDAQSFKPRPPLLNPYEVMLKRRMRMGAETFEAKTANYILFMDFLEEAFYDEDSEVYKARQELYPDDKKSELTISKLYRLYCFYIYYDRIPQRIKDKRTIDGQIKWVRGKMNMGGMWNKHNREGYLNDSQFKNAIMKARRKYSIRFDGDNLTDWMNYNGKIYHVRLIYKIGFSTLKNQYAKKMFKRLPMNRQRQIMKGN